MNRKLFFKACRKAAEIARVRQLTVFGSAAIIAWARGIDPSEELWFTSDVDVDPGSEEKATEIDAVAGEGSPFHEENGVYVQGVGIEAFQAPADWESRSRKFGIPRSNAKILVPHPRDLVVAKLVAGREHDWEFARFCVERFGVKPEEVEAGLRTVAREKRRLAPAAEKAMRLLPHRLPPRSGNRS